ncbi:ef hand family protein [Stylonychia lemnae]|uniref:Ef hand family protein n=1 Tax=Stylonychia lemnae TaxID=5949 RepID=A0A078A1B2_STYLE|nr:ef hand family protein [Stylonychia lemnae]|eukprot:CDW76041.1 ef hand family protein [Stylonychia lemnae]
MNKKEISMTTKKRLAKLFTYTGEAELDLELARQNLCKAQQFEPYASFQRIDRGCKGYLSIRDFLNFMKDNGVDSMTDLDVQLLINYFDSTSDGKLLYTDYLQMLLPCDQPYIRALTTQRPTYPVGQSEFLPFDVEKLLANLIYKELKLAREQERLKNVLSERYDYESKSLFKDVDDINYNYIDASNLRRYLIKTGQLATDQLLISILRRFDLDADARLSLQEFCDGIKPQTPDAAKKCHGEKYQSLVASRLTQKSKTKNHYQSVRSHSRERTIQTTSKKQKNQSIVRPVTATADKNSVIKTNNTMDMRKSSMKQFDTIQQVKTTQFQEDLLGLSGNNIQAIRSQRVEDYNASYLRLKTGSSPVDYRQSFTQSQSIKSPQRSTITHFEHFSPQSTLQHQRVTSQFQTSQYGDQQQNEIDVSLMYLVRDSFKQIMKFEGEVEYLKRDLAGKQDFTLAGVFNMFTGYSQTRINASDILYGLERLEIQCDIADVKLVVSRYDADQDSRLGFWEFSNIFLPIQPLLRDELERRKAQWDISFDTKELLRRLLRKIIETEIFVESVRQRSNNQPQVSIRKAYDSLDWLNRGYITDNELRRGFDQVANRYSQTSIQTINHYRLDNDEVECFIRRFNKDKLNGRISLAEFLDELSPKCPEKPY